MCTFFVQSHRLHAAILKIAQSGYGSLLILGDLNFTHIPKVSDFFGVGMERSKDLLPIVNFNFGLGFREVAGSNLTLMRVIVNVILIRSRRHTQNGDGFRPKSVGIVDVEIHELFIHLAAISITDVECASIG